MIGYLKILTVFAAIFFLSCVGHADVQLIDQGTTVTLDNGIISFKIDKALAQITSMKKGSQELMGGGGRGYFQREHQGGIFTLPQNCIYSVIRNTPDIAEISLVENNPAHYPFYFDARFVLKKNESGFYNYIILEYEPSIVPQTSIVLLDLCLRIDPELFVIAQVTDDRWIMLPTPQDFVNGEVIGDATVQLLPDSIYAQMYDDSIYTKYNMIAMFRDHKVHGMCGNGNGYGVWLIQGNDEYLNGIPGSQELTVHQSETTPVILGMAHGVHFGSAELILDIQSGNWRKIFGPMFVYVNQGNGREAMWADATNKAAEHAEQWPYEWMNDSGYPTIRGSVRGQIKIKGDINPKGTLVVLAQPQGEDVPHWRKQGKGYAFYSNSDSNGFFTIENVRAGSYSLYADVSGVMDEFRYDGISVTAGNTADLGLLEWTPVKYGRQEWQIGIPDRDSTEFRNGDDFRHWGEVMRDRYMQDFPNSVEYAIGASDWRVDWNYVQPTIPNGSGGYTDTKWGINFNLSKKYTGTAYLRIGIAGSRESTLKVTLGRYTLANTVLDAVGELYPNQGYPRSASRGYYKELVIPFPASYLAEGANRIVLNQTRITQFASIHYDCVRLELPYKADINNDFEVNMLDLALFANGWSAGNSLADFNNDGKVDEKDLKVLSEEWLK